MSEIQLRAMVDAKIDRAIASGEPCPFNPLSAAAAVFHARRQSNQNTAANPGRVDLAQGA